MPRIGGEVRGVALADVPQLHKNDQKRLLSGCFEGSFLRGFRVFRASESQTKQGPPSLVRCSDSILSAPRPGPMPQAGGLGESTGLGPGASPVYTSPASACIEALPSEAVRSSCHPCQRLGSKPRPSNVRRQCAQCAGFWKVPCKPSRPHKPEQNLRKCKRNIMGILGFEEKARLCELHKEHGQGYLYVLGGYDGFNALRAAPVFGGSFGGVRVRMPEAAQSLSP